MSKRALILAALVLVSAMPLFAVSTKDMASGVTADEIAKTLTGAGITISSTKVTGSSKSIGTFTGGLADGLAVDGGVIMSSGDIATAAGPNTSEGTTGSMAQGGDASLNALVAPLQTHDAIVFEFDAVTTSPVFSIKYVFASEEYKEYVDSKFNDVFAFFVDGTNIALVPGKADPVAINTINHKTNSGFFNDNPAGSKLFETSFDGFTVELTAVASVTPGVPHHIKLAIADTSDSILDSAVYLSAGGISGTGIATAVVPEIDELQVFNLEQQDVKVTVFGVPEGVTPEMSAFGLPEDTKVTFKRIADVGANTPQYLMHISVGPDTGAGFYPLAIRALLGEQEVFGAMRILIDCVPPMILSAPGNQPLSQTVTSGSKVKLSVKPVGSSGLRYQWYLGSSGSTLFPISGATAADYTIDSVTSAADYWVRVSNACGSVDSATASVKPQ